MKTGQGKRVTRRVYRHIMPGGGGTGATTLRQAARSLHHQRMNCDLFVNRAELDAGRIDTCMMTTWADGSVFFGPWRPARWKAS